LFGSLRHQFDPLDREILERAFDATLALVANDRIRTVLRKELIEAAESNELSDAETLRDLVLARLQFRSDPGSDGW
jgi:hypothetical protein